MIGVTTTSSRVLPVVMKSVEGFSCRFLSPRYLVTFMTRPAYSITYKWLLPIKFSIIQLRRWLYPTEFSCNWSRYVSAVNAGIPLYVPDHKFGAIAFHTCTRCRISWSYFGGRQRLLFVDIWKRTVTWIALKPNSEASTINFQTRIL